jgi:hypothetical protein
MQHLYWATVPEQRADKRDTVSFSPTLPLPWTRTEHSRNCYRPYTLGKQVTYYKHNNWHASPTAKQQPVPLMTTKESLQLLGGVEKHHFGVGEQAPVKGRCCSAGATA